MKLHLPLSLRRALTGALALAALSTAEAGIQNPYVSIMTYVDFGQNCGRYAVGNINALLGYIREQEGGVLIKYPNATLTSFVLPHGMIDFSSSNDGGFGAMISYNFYATVQHNASWSGTVTGNYIGGNNAINYQSVMRLNSNKFDLTPSNDYRISRMNKLVTDVVGSTVYGQDDRNWSASWGSGLNGEYLYRSGSGCHYRGTASNSINWAKSAICFAYEYITGAMVTITSSYVTNNSDGAYSVWGSQINYNTIKGVNSKAPLPFTAINGDSGSPSWVWNKNTEQFEYVAACQSGNAQANTQYRGAPEWTVKTMESFNVSMDLGNAAVTLDANGRPIVEVHIGAVDTSTGITIRDSSGYTASPWKGQITDGKGNVLSEYIGMKSGHNSWKDLSDWKDKDNWFHYGNDKLDTSTYGLQEYLQTNDLVFVSRTDDTNIIVDANVDLGVGYVRLSKSKELPVSNVTISGDYMLNSAGYVVDEGVNLHLQLTNGTDRAREWRAIVEEGGALYIEGSGDNNNMLLNLGRQGTTYLQRDGGYAAYNVLQSCGGTVVIRDIGQIERDFTFGYQGGVLDMHGNSMTWNNSNAADAEGFTIHALDEQAVISNLLKESVTTLTWTQDGSRTWLGSFVDTPEGGALHFVYDGGAGAVLTMKSIHTSLQNEGSGISVDSGKLVLSGSNTVHGKGSANGRSAKRFSSTDDWHYADATTNVTINAGGTFELASHARLTGNVIVNEGGTFIMKENVKRQWEYVEGGETKENVELYKDFYGLKGEVINNGTFFVKYSNGIVYANEFDGVIRGTGTTIVDIGVDNGTFVFSGTHLTTGAREVRSGKLVLRGSGVLETATGDSAWLVSEKGVLSVENLTLAEALPHVHANSNGAYALLADEATLDLSSSPNLFIGAAAGKTIHVGTADSAIAAWHTEATGDSGETRTQWLFGGGGGNLYVDGLLTGDNDLVLGNAYTRGTVTLTNVNNDFSGNVIFNGPTTLDCTDVRALGDANIILGYGNRVSSQVDRSHLDAASSGATLLAAGDAASDIDLGNWQGLAISAAVDMTYTGSLTVAEGATYRFGALQGTTLTIDTDLAEGHDLLVDGQTYTNGTVTLARAQALNSNVTVLGYDVNQAHVSSGSITLKLAAENALASASSITLKVGGTIDIAGRNQTLNNVTMEAGSTITDSTVDGVLTLNNTTGTSLRGSIDVNTLVKTGSGALSLGGTNYYDTFDVYAGTITLASNTALCSSGVTRLHGGTLVMNGCSLAGEMRLEGATLNMGDGGTIASGAKLVASGNTTSKIIATGTAPKLNVNGDIGAEVGSTLRFEGREIYMNCSTMNSAGGTIVTGANLHMVLNTSVNRTIGGTLWIQGQSGVQSGFLRHSAANGTSLTVDTLKCSSTVMLYEQSAYGSWNIRHLEGSGLLNNFFMYHGDNVTAVRFLDEGHFSGTVNYCASQSNTAKYTLFYEVDHDLALQNALVYLTAYHSSTGYTEASNLNARTGFAINTENAHIAGLNGLATSHLYAGKAATATSASRATSTRVASLTIGGAGNYNFKGTVASDGTNGLNIVMNGTGSQAFTGTGVNFLNATVERGTLKLNSNGVTIAKDVSIAQGGTLLWGAGASAGDGTYALVAGKSLTAIASQYDVASNVSATLNGSLSLNGGTLGFESAALLAADTALSITGTIAKGDSFGIAQQVDVKDAVSLEFGHEYHLVNGDWTDIASTEVVLAPFSPYADNYVVASFSTNENGLYGTFQLADNAYLWYGTEDCTDWVAAAFYGDKTSTPGTDDVAVFSNRAESTDVQIGVDVNAGSLLFDSDKDYTLTAAEGSTVTAGSLVQLRVAHTTIAAVSHFGKVLLDKGQLTLNGDTTVTQTMDLHAGTVTTVNGTATVVGDLALGSGAAALVRDGVAVTGGIVMGQGAGLSIGGSSTAGSLNMAKDTGIVGIGESAGLSLSGGLTMPTATGGSVSIENLRLTAATKLDKVYNTVTATIILSQGSVVDDRLSYYGVTRSSLNFSNVETWEWVPDPDGAEDDDGNLLGEYVLRESSGGTYYINGFRMSNNQGTSASAINVASGITLVVTGDVCGQAGSFSFSHWPNGTNTDRNQNPANVFNLYGTATSNAKLSAWDARGELNVYSGGTLNLLKGLSRNTERANIIAVNVDEGGRINAAGGEQNAALTVALASGATLGAIGDNVTFSNNMSLGTPNASGAVTIDTDAHSVGTDFAMVKGMGGNINFTGTLNSLNGTSLAIAGAGSATFTGALTVGSDVLVQDTASFTSRGNRVDIRGAMCVAEGAHASMENVTLLSGFTLSEGSLDLAGAMTFTTNGIVNNGSITIADGTSFALDYSYFKDDSFLLISGEGGITYSGAAPTITVSGFDTGTISPTIVANSSTLSIGFDIPNLIWNGTEGQGWNMDDKAWASKGKGAFFTSMARVTFDGSGSREVNVATNATPLEMTIENATGEGYRFTTDNGGTIAVYSDLNSASTGTTNFEVATTVGRDARLSGSHCFSDLTVTRDLVLEGAESSASFGNLTVTGATTMDGEGASIAATGAVQVADLTISGANSRADFSGSVSAANLSISGSGTQANFTGKVSTSGKLFIGEGATVTVLDNADGTLNATSNEIKGRLVLNVTNTTGTTPLKHILNTSGKGVVVKTGAGNLQVWSVSYLNSSSHYEIQEGTLSFARGSTIGTVDVTGTTALASLGNGNNFTNTVNVLNITANGSLTYVSEYAIPTVVNKLTGSGELRLLQKGNANTNTHTVSIGGSGGFSGLIEVDYAPTVLKLTGNGAVNGAFLDLKQGTLYVNANNTLRGLNGGENTALYTAANDKTLTVNTAEGTTHTFAGSVNGTASQALGLTKNGEGTLTFNKTGILRTLTQTGGTLNFAASAPAATTFTQAVTMSGTSALNLGGAASVGSNLTMSDSAKASVGGSLSVGGNLTASDSSKADVNGDLSVRGALSASQDAALSVTGNASVTGAAAATQNVVWTVGGNVTVGGNLSVANNAAVTFSGDSTALNANVFVYGSAQLNVAGDTAVAGAVTMTENAVLSFGGDSTSIGGTVTMTGGTLNLGGSLTLGGTITNGGTVNFAEGSTLHFASSALAGEGFTVVTGSGTLNHSLGLSSLVIDNMGCSEWKDVYCVLFSDTGKTIAVALQESSQDQTWSVAADSTNDVIAREGDVSVSVAGGDTVTVGNLDMQGTDKTASFNKSEDAAAKVVLTGTDSIVSAGNTVTAESVTVKKDAKLTVAAVASEESGVAAASLGDALPAVNMDGDLTVKEGATLNIAKAASIAVDGELTMEDGAIIELDELAAGGVVLATAQNGIDLGNVVITGAVVNSYSHVVLSTQKVMSRMGFFSSVVSSGPSELTASIVDNEITGVGAFADSTLTLTSNLTSTYLASLSHKAVSLSISDTLMTDILAKVDGNAFSITLLSKTDGDTLNLSGFTVTFTGASGLLTVGDSATWSGNTGSSFRAYNVPEVTTGTFSVLALAVLSSRRRRQKQA